MKIALMICSLSLALCLPALASENGVIKTCSTVLSMPGDSLQVDTKIEIYSELGSLSSTVTQTSQGQTTSYGDEAQIEEHNVKAGLTADLNQVDNLNLAEKLIVHALVLTEEPEMKGVMSAGFDLRKVRSAKVYTVGKPTHMGLTAIVEAKDEAGKDLGSFFGGFLVSPCK
jgi:hypothetical protein